MSLKIFDDDLVEICKTNVTLTLNKPAYVGMCILDLSKVLMQEFHYDYIKTKYSKNSSLSFTGTDSLMYEIKTDDVYQFFSKNKEMFDFSSYSAKLKYFDDSKKLDVAKMKHETTGVAIEEFVRLNPKMCSFWVDNSSEHKKVKGVNRNVFAKISHNEYKDVQLNQKCLRYLMNRI